MAESFSNLILRMTRTFDATPDRVFAAWTDPEQFGQWFGPVGVKTVSCEIDARVGGAWGLVGEHDNARMAVSGKYVEIEPPDRLVYTFAWHEKGDFALPRGQESVVTVVFTPVGQRTEMIFTQAVFRNEEAVAAHNRGWTDSFDKLGDILRRAP